jgi:hypothetical protein
MSDWKSADPESLSDADLLRRVEADKPGVRLRQFAALAALAAMASAAGYAWSGNPLTAEQSELMATPAFAAEAGSSTGVLEEKSWLGAQTDPRSETGRSMARLSVAPAPQGAGEQKTQSNATAARAQGSGARPPVLEIQVETAQTPPRQEDGTLIAGAANYAVSDARWTVGGRESVSVKQAGPGRWRIEPIGAREPMVVWAYATGSEKTSDGRRVATGRVGAVSVREITAIREKERQFGRREDICCGVFMAFILVMMGVVHKTINGPNGAEELRQRRKKKTGLFAAMDEAKALAETLAAATAASVAGQQTASAAGAEAAQPSAAPRRNPQRI